MTELVYLDNNATTKVADEVVKAMVPYLATYYGNPSSVYGFGALAADAVESARAQVASLLGARHPHEIIFTACGSESDNTAVHVATRALPNRRRIVTSAVEHLAILDTCRAYREEGYEVVEVPVDGDGRLDMEALDAAVDENTCLVTLMSANNESGVALPVEEAAAIARERGALFHTDAVQVAGKVPLDFGANEAIAMASVSAHKFHGPKGIGALYVREGTPFSKFMKGGHQERNRRAGTEAVALIVGMGAAASFAQRHLAEESGRVRELRDRLQEGLVERIPRALVIGEGAPRTPNTLSIAFDNVDEEFILRELDRRGICASSGSACNSEVIEPSHVMVAMGVAPEYLNGVIRFSLSCYNSAADIDQVLACLPAIVEEGRSRSIFS